MRFSRGLPTVLAVASMVVLAMAVSLETPTAHGLGPITSQGVQVHAAQAWHDAGFNGVGIKVGIIDGGFQGMGSQLGREFPATVTVRCYTSLGRFTDNLADCENGIDHGTDSAESVMDLAPGASLYLSNPTSYLDTRNTVDWMVGQGVSVIYYAYIDIFEGPGDGSTPFRYGILNTVDAAVAGGAAWVNPAGNYGQRTWFGTPRWSPLGFLEFHGNDVFNSMALRAGDRITLELRWEDSWEAARRNLDLIIWDEAALEIVAFSFDRQGRRPGQVPHEILQFQAPQDGLYSAVVTYPPETVAPNPGWAQLLVRGDIGSIKYHTGVYSIGNPADSANPGLLAVGASHWSTPSVIEPFSSRGPTPDLRVKPDVVAAQCAVTSRNPLDSYGDGFCGTSQAAAHAAGMVALARQRFPDYSNMEVAAWIKLYALQQAMPDPNNTWGWGFAAMPDPVPPTPPMIHPIVLTGPDWITATWPVQFILDQGGGLVESYDLRYIEQRADPSVDANWTVVPGAWTPGGAALEYTITGLTGGTPYYVQARGTNVWGTGEWSASASGLTSPPGVPGVPTGLTAAASQTEALVDLSWTAPVFTGGASVTGYRIELSPDGNDPWTEVFTTTGASTTYTDDGTDANGPVFAHGEWPHYRVAAVNPVGTGPFSESVYSGEDPFEREALVALYSATDGRNWKNNDGWLSDEALGEWYGVTTNSTGRVASLALGGNRLSGEIPPELGSLSSLEELDLGIYFVSSDPLDADGNQLSGEIPSELGSLSNLRWLDLGGNQLSGEIPSELGGLSNLTNLVLD